jgi:hypothetical protein
MLFKLPSSTLPSTSKSNLVTGKSLAHRKMSATQRALLVADIRAGEKEFKPTLGQLARDARVSVPYARSACQIHHDPDARLDVLSGSCSLLTAAARHRRENGKGKKGKAKAMTPAAWAKADPATRRKHIADLGLASVWDVIDQLTR